MQPKYEFQSSLYRDAREVADAIAGEWITAGGINSREDQARFLADMTDAELAAEAIEGWGLAEPVEHGWNEEGEPVELPWLETRDIDQAGIAAAFARYRASF